MLREFKPSSEPKNANEDLIANGKVKKVSGCESESVLGIFVTFRGQ